MEEKIQRIANDMLNLYKIELEQSKINASNTLSDTAKTEIIYNKNGFSIYFRLQNYWYYVENGRKAGKMPPVNILYNWIIRKRINFIPDRKIRNHQSLAWAVSKSIAKKGYEGKKPLNKVINSKEFKSLVEELEDIVFSGYEDEIDKIIESV